MTQTTTPPPVPLTDKLTREPREHPDRIPAEAAHPTTAVVRKLHRGKLHRVVAPRERPR
jgi:hypothetical protein